MGSPAAPLFLKIGVTVARFQASGNMPVEVEQVRNRGADDWCTLSKNLVGDEGCAVALAMGCVKR